MKLIPSALCMSVLALCGAAHGTVTGSLGGNGGTLLSLTPAGLNGGAVAALVGGTTYTNDMPFADIPKGTVTEFLAVGPQAGQPATLTFTSPVTFLSFLWGSPDLYNMLTVNSTGSSQLFTVSNLNFLVTDGNQNFSQYVQFVAAPGSFITSLVFNNVPGQDAFEAANFSVTPVPEAPSVALLVAGLGAIAFISRRRQRGSAG
jgi:MYXO-CTERM domain-containing protein